MSDPDDATNEAGGPTSGLTPAAWAELVEAIGPASLLVVIERRMSEALLRHHDAEDILQEALLHAWRDRDRCTRDGAQGFRRWVLAIIDHRLMDLTESANRQKRGSGRAALRIGAGGENSSSDGSAPDPAVSATPSRSAMRREAARVMREAIAAVPDELQAVLWLRVFEDRSLEDVAERCGLGLSAVRHRLRRGAAIYFRELQRRMGSAPGG